MSTRISVPEITIGDHISVIKRENKIKKSEYLEKGLIPVIDQGQDFIAGYIDDEARAYDDPLPVIVFGDHTCTKKFIDFRFAVGADGTQLLRPKNPKQIDVRYLYYALLYVPLEQFGYQRHFKYLKDAKIPLPDLNYQRKIAAILSAYDNLIDNNLRRIKILEEMAQTLYREWFVKFRFPAYAEASAGKPGHQKVKMVDSPLGKIPDGWEVKHLSDVCSILMGQSPKSEFYNIAGEGLPFHQGVTDFGERFPTTRVYCTFAGRIAETGDILFSVRAPVGRLNLTDRKIIIGRGLSAIRNLDGYQCFAFHQLKEIFTEEDIMGGGTIFKAVTKGDMERIECLYPLKEYLVRFETICSPIAEQLAVLGKKNRILRQTRDLLLPKLISGELDVSGLDIKNSEPEEN